jgi:hypothetical protein
MKYKFLALTTLLSAVLISSCLKQEFDSPPDSSQYDPALPVQTTLRDLTYRALELGSGSSYKMGDTTVYGVVVANDRTGNIYKQIIIQDTSGGGMAIFIDKTTLYGDYPVGRKVYLKLNGLMLYNYNGLPQIVYDFGEDGKSNGIPSSVLDKYIIKSSYPHPVVPTTVTMIDIFSNPTLYLNTLIKIENVQFEASSANVVYSDDVRSTSRYVSDCPFTAKMQMYNSSFSDFRGAITPNGKGALTAILSIYNSPQLILRDTTDVEFTQPRECP